MEQCINLFKTDVVQKKRLSDCKNRDARVPFIYPVFFFFTVHLPRILFFFTLKFVFNPYFLENSFNLYYQELVTTRGP